jgi:hypothetical protein
MGKTMKGKNILEEEIKNTLAAEFFSKFDCTKILGKIDFAVRLKRPKNTVDLNDGYLLWAEAKQKPTDILVMLTQLVLTVGKARTFDEILPPPFLGCCDNEKMAFVPYSEIQDIFYQNDFNWNVTPSNHDTKEFKQVYAQIRKIIENEIPWETYLFYFKKDEKELRRFIRENFVAGKDETTQIKIDKNNFITVYSKWLETVKPTIQVSNWDTAKKAGIIDGDFYLADLLSDENKTLKEKLFVLLKTNHYELDRKIDESGFENFKTTAFSDNQKAHTQFWAKYERPPLEDYWDYIVERRDQLVPQDVRERKGSFFTPKIWVELSQCYIATVLGDNWQDEYYVWDCCAGTGNLLAGLTNKYNIWASTLDKQDVDVMHDRIKNGANLLESHVFQFDFLNDDFSKLPQGLQDIVNNEEKRKKLLIYINPPYAEAGDSKQRTGTGKNKEGTATANAVYNKYKNIIGKASNELFTQFLIRIYCEVPTAKIANFSTLKNLQSFNFSDFRIIFRAKLEKLFLVPADTFDNVKGQFPIGFFIWNTEVNENFEQILSDIYVENNKQAVFTGQKTVFCYDNTNDFINKWIVKYKNKKEENKIGVLITDVGDFQNQNQVFILNNKEKVKGHKIILPIVQNNLVQICIYFAIRKVIPANWLNDRDQFLYPNDAWGNDAEFQNDCLAYTLFNNNIQSKYGVNHWIPFTEYQVGAQDKFDSRFMTDFISGKANFHTLSEPDLFYFAAGDSSGGGYGRPEYEPKERKFSPAAQAVFAAGKELWKYYHSQKNCNANASLYDIKEYFQGRNEKGKMNSKSGDETYMLLIANLKECLKVLAKKIEPKVYVYGFLKK